jgi:hypothetical protein
VAPTIDSLTITDDPQDWADAGFTVDTVDEDASCTIGFTRIRLSGPATTAADGRPPSGLVAWAIRDLGATGSTGEARAGSSCDVDGIPTTISASELPDPGEHANGAVRIDHVVLTAGDGERAQRALEGIGWDLRRVRDVPGARVPTEQRFFRAGEVILELVAPTEPTPADRDRHTRLYGLALVSADLDATVASFHGACNAPKDAVQQGRRIATLRTRDLGISVPIAFMTP